MKIKHFNVFVAFSLFFLVLGQVSLLHAEGTRTVSPSSVNVTALAVMPSVNSGNYLNCPEDNRIYFNVANHSTENFYYGFQWRNYGGTANPAVLNNMYMKIFKPDGSLAAGPILLPTSGAGFINTYTAAYEGPNIAGTAPLGYTPLSFDPTVNGEHWIEIYRSNTSGTSQIDGATWSLAPYFDMTVATTAGTRYNGRVHSDKWGFVAINATFVPEATASSEPTTYAYTQDQSVLKVDFQPGFKPIAFNLAVNYYGVTNTGNFDIDRKSINAAVAPSLANGYKIFLNIPDAAVYPVAAVPASPTLANPIFIGCPPSTTTVRYYLPGSGDVKMLFDMNGIPGYQVNTADRYIEAFQQNAGLNAIVWDGKDGLGNPVSSGSSFTIGLIYEKGRFNVPIYDAEINSNGLNIAAVAPVAVANSVLFWDDSGLTNVGSSCGSASDNANNTTGTGLANTKQGTLSPSHAWNGNGNLLQVIPAPAVGTSETDGLQCSDFGNVRVINTYGWAITTSTTVSIVAHKCVTIAGTLWDDANKSANGTNNNIFSTGETGTNMGTALYATLIDPATGNVIESVPVASNGTYLFTSAPANANNLTIRLTSTLGIAGSTPPAVVIPTGNWAATSPLEQQVNTGTSNLTGIDFGVEQLPIPANHLAASQVNPCGTNQVTVAPNTFSATDVDGTVTNIRITTFPTNATSIMINGVVYTAANFPATGITIPTNAAGEPLQTIKIDPIDGDILVEIPYKAIDNAGMESNTTAIAKLPFTTLSISGNVFKDVTSLADGLVNGDPVSTAGDNKLYVHLLDNNGMVVGSTLVLAGGVYNFSGLNSGDYTLVLSSNQASVSESLPNAILPQDWENTGENIGAGIGNDGLANGKLAVSLTNVSITNANFGINISGQYFPVEIENLTVRWQDEKARLIWATLSEINSDYFQIERSVDETVSFEAIGQVKATGSSQKRVTYDFFDKEAQTINLPKIYYRLRMVDLDGTYEYSETVELVNPQTTKEIYTNVYPNPANDYLYIDYQFYKYKLGKLRVVDIAGKVVYQQDLTSGLVLTQQYLDISTWQDGVYFVNILVQDQNKTHKIIKSSGQKGPQAQNLLLLKPTKGYAQLNLSGKKENGAAYHYANIMFDKQESFLNGKSTFEDQDSVWSVSISLFSKAHNEPVYNDILIGLNIKKDGTLSVYRTIGFDYYEKIDNKTILEVDGSYYPSNKGDTGSFDITNLAFDPITRKISFEYKGNINAAYATTAQSIEYSGEVRDLELKEVKVIK